jgi:hypothetical protein
VVSGAFVTLSGAATGSGTTGSDGNTIIKVNAGSAGTITATASRTGYASGTTTVTANLVSPVFTRVKIGVYKEGIWYLDYDGSGTWNAGDRANMFGAIGWMPLIGDWNGDNKAEIGVYQNGVWYLDSNGNGAWDNGVDYAYSFGAPGWTPVPGKWS